MDLFIVKGIPIPSVHLAFGEWIGSSDHIPIEAVVRSKPNQLKPPPRVPPISARNDEKRLRKAKELYNRNLPVALGKICAADSFDEFQKAYTYTMGIYRSPMENEQNPPPVPERGVRTKPTRAKKKPGRKREKILYLGYEVK